MRHGPRIDWIDRGQFAISPNTVIDSAWLVIVVRALHYLDNAAIASWREFQPVLSLEEHEVNEIEYRLTTLPAGWTAAVSLLGPILFALVHTDPYRTLDMFDLGDPRLRFVTHAAGAVMVATFPVFIYHSIHQLRLVSRIHDRVDTIDTNNLRPLFAFSGLSARTGIVLMAALYVNMLEFRSRNLARGLAWRDLLFIGPNVFFAVLAFLLPLWGMHRKLVEAKETAAGRLRERLKLAHEEIEGRIETGKVMIEPELERAFALINRQLSMARGLSTWPWSPGTLSGFLSAMILPIVLYLVQQVLGSILGGS